MKKVERCRGSRLLAKRPMVLIDEYRSSEALAGVRQSALYSPRFWKAKVF